MKRTLAIVASLASLVLAVSLVSASAKDKEVTVTGEAKCAKCMLKEGTACQTVIQVEKNGKTRNYYVTDNDISKGFHEDVCHEAKKVTATGTLAKAGGKSELTLSKIEVAK
jgi:hypothetical protein